VNLLLQVDPYRTNTIAISEVVARFSQYMVDDLKPSPSGQTIALLEKFANCCNVERFISEQKRISDA